jgi:SAM-dependent methyltransferase
MPPRRAEPDEPLAENARLARSLAPRLCRVDPATGESCAWNHGLWPTLRLLGLVLTPAHHAAFFQRALAAAAREGGPLRVLISGSADTGMPAQVFAALRARGVQVLATVLDLCETPLELNRRYAARAGMQIETVRADVLEYRPREPFDVVCTHSFLSMFPAGDRPALVSRWHALLRPGGVAITVNRVRGEAAAGSLGFEGDQARAFCAAVRDAAAAPGFAADREQLAADAAIYAARRRIHPVRSAQDVRALFENAGFELAELSCAPLAERPAGRAGGPTLPGDGDYLHVIARRPAR